jgi:transcriptional regulator of acetoin/glycerol metabolism
VKKPNFANGHLRHTRMANLKTGSRSNGASANQSRAITPLWKVEKAAILAALKKLNGDKILAARKLGIGKTTLYRKLKEYRIRIQERRVISVMRSAR